MPGRVVVVGSANVDLVLRVPHIVAPGETLLALTAARGGGGKGANQAVACARDGVDVAFVGAVGDDADGRYLRQCLDVEGISLEALATVDVATGLAVVTVAADGENAIVVVPGANHALESLSVAAAALVAAADVVLLQLEIPLPLVMAAVQVATGTVVLNAAPATVLPAVLLVDVDVLVVNESEAAALVDVLSQVPAVVTTLGGAGAVLRRRGEADLAVAGRRVEVVDTTGAGDTFCGVLAAGLARRLDWPQVLERATAAAAVAVQRAGAQAPPTPR